jgi:glucose-6-phosphate 1-epimerase
MLRKAADLRSQEIPGVARFQDELGGLVSLTVTAPSCSARFFTQGAHLTEWTPSGEEPVLFTSKKSLFAPGKAIRGGVPICFPWFAARAGHPKSPAHGVVRAAEWAVHSITAAEPNGSVSVAFSISDSEASREEWPHAFHTVFRVKLGRTLEMALHVENRGSDPFTFEEALHTYFCVGDIHSVEIHGLEGAEYIDKVDAFARKRRPNEPLRFAVETDSVFPGTTATCVLRDPARRRAITVEKSESQTTVVWNPWIAKAAAMADFGDDEWPSMACIETANSGENTITLPPGATHVMTARISTSKL